MGSNRRYDLISGDIERAGEVWKRRPEPVELTAEQVASSGNRRAASEAVQVSAWVPHRISYDEPQLIEADAIAWTDRAVLVRWTSAGGVEHTAWVWASAVTRR